MLTFGFIALCAGGAWASDGSKANTSRAARDEAIRAIPFDRLPKEARQKAQRAIEQASLFRRLPTQTIDCDSDLYLFLLRHPDVVVNMWQLLGISRMTLDRVEDDRFSVADGEGTKGHMEYLYSTPELHVIYSEGTYDGPLYARTVRGRCLMLLRTAYRRDGNGRQVVTSQLDTFLAVDNLGVEILARTFQPIVGKAADHNFAETATFISKVSRTAEVNERGVARLAGKLTRCSELTRGAFAQAAAAVAEKTAVSEIYAEGRLKPQLATGQSLIPAHPAER